MMENDLGLFILTNMLKLQVELVDEGKILGNSYSPSQFSIGEPFWIMTFIEVC